MLHTLQCDVIHLPQPLAAPARAPPSGRGCPRKRRGAGGQAGYRRRMGSGGTRSAGREQGPGARFSPDASNVEKTMMWLPHGT